MAGIVVLLRTMGFANLSSKLSMAALLCGTSLLAACSSDSDSNDSLEDTSLTEQEQFLETNAARAEVLVTDSGLQYEVLRAAEGEKPTRTSVITVHYIGALIDGTEFDNSYDRGVPNTFNLSGTIDGWIEGVQLMSVNSKYRFVLPADLAYGEKGADALIEPGATLIYEIELLEINSN